MILTLLFFTFLHMVFIPICPVFSIYQKPRANLVPFEYREGQRFVFFPDGNDKLHIVDLRDKKQDTRWKFDPTRDVVLNLFTRTNFWAPIIIDTDNVRSSLETNSVNVSKPIKFVIHGWKSGLFGKIHTTLTADLLNSGDVNVIFVDWNTVADKSYVLVVGAVPDVGKYLASVIDSLVDLGMPLKNIHLIGHSLGAHIAGIAGRMLTSGKLSFITGFDPALPLWPEKSARIRPSDAEYVEIIHTNAGILGLKDPVGHADFYPNGGTIQPGCTFDLACAHSRSFLYYADSLDHDLFKARQCANMLEVESGKCTLMNEAYMGGGSPKNITGLFYLVTNKERPFYTGYI